MKTDFAPKLLFLLILIASSTVMSQSIQLKAFKLNDRSNLLTDTSKLTEKSPLLAGTLSFIVPGAGFGQKYNGQEGKFLRHSLISLGCFFLFFATGGRFNENPLWGPDGINYALGFVILAYAGNWIWSIVDAIVSANDINKQVKLQKYRSNTFDKFKFGFMLNERKQLNIKLGFQL